LRAATAAAYHRPVVNRTRLVIIPALAAAASLLAAEARAYDFTVTARTEGQGYQLRRYERNGVVFVNRRRLTQYLGLRIYNLIDPGQDAFSPSSSKRPPRLLSFHLLMRFDADFAGYMAPGQSIPELKNNIFDLVAGGLEGRNLLGRIDFSLGRLYDMELLDIFAYDGLRVRVNLPYTLYAGASFGVQVARAHPLARAVFETDGPCCDAAAEAWSPTFSAVAGMDGLWDLDLKVAYRGTVSRAPQPGAAAGADSIWGVDQELVYVGAGWQVPVIGIMPSLGVRYNLLTAQVDDLSVGLRQRIAGRHDLSAGYLRTIPHFDGDSIFNIFDTEPYHEASLRYALRIMQPLSAYLRLGYRRYWSDETEARARPDGYSAAMGARWRDARLGAGLDLYYLDGHAGQTYGGDLDGRWVLLRWLTLQGRLSLIQHEGSGGSLAAASGLNFGAQLGALVTFFEGVTGHLLFEDNISRQYSSALRLLGVLTLEVSP